jgi:hypothetical protein
MRILLFSCDVLGLVISGLVATGGMKYILRNGLKYGTMAAFLRGTKKDPEGQKYLLQMEGAYSDNSYLVRLDQAEGYVTPRNPKIGWVDFSETQMSGTFIALPARENVPENIREQLIVELYSK